MLSDTLTTMGALGLEVGLNAALALDSSLKEKVAAKQGKILCLVCTEPEMSIAIVLGERCLVLRSIHWTDEDVSASLIGSSDAWLEMLRSEDKAAALINSSLQLRGDSSLFQEIAQLAETIDLDWESALAGLIGNVPTHITSRVISQSVSKASLARTFFENSVKDYFESTDSVVVSKSSSDAFYNDIRRLEMAVERLEAKIQKL